MKKITVLLTMLFVLSIGATAFAADPFTFSGDLRLRFDKETQADNAATEFQAYKYRIRLNAAYKISPAFTFNSRVVVGESLTSAGPNDTTTGVDNVQMDIASLTYKEGNYSIVAGRQKLAFFEGMAINQDPGHSSSSFDAAGLSPNGSNYTFIQGVKASGKLGDVTLTGFTGNVMDQNALNYNLRGVVAQAPIGDVNTGFMWYQNYRQSTGGYYDDKGSHTGYALTANTKLFDKYLYVGAEYDFGAQYGNGSDDKAYRVQIYTPATKKAGDMQYAFDYRKAGKNALDDKLSSNTKATWKTSDYGAFSFWAVSAKRQLTKDVYATLYYEKYNPDTNTIKVEDHLYRLEVGVAF